MPNTFGKGKLRHLKVLDLSKSEYLVQLPERLCSLYSLQQLNLQSCLALVELPHSLFELNNLEGLYLQRCITLLQLPLNLGRLAKLRVLDCEECVELMELPDPVTTKKLFPRLESLNLAKCTSLKKLPAWAEHMEGGGVAIRKP